MIKWKKLLTRVLTEYKQVNKIRYAYITLKYFERYSAKQIEKSLYIDLSAQRRIKCGIFLDIAKYATEDGLISA